MRSLSKSERARVAELAAAIRAAHAALQDECSVANLAIAAVNERVASYNEAVETARAFAEDIGSEIEAYMDERSEKWAESDAAQSYASWRDAWSGFTVDELEDFDELAAPDEVTADELEGLPEAPDAS
jgi:hypothetical protein